MSLSIRSRPVATMDGERRRSGRRADADASATVLRKVHSMLIQVFHRVVRRGDMDGQRGEREMRGMKRGSDENG